MTSMMRWPHKMGVRQELEEKVPVSKDPEQLRLFVTLIGIARLDDATWKSLSKAAQAWYNSCVDAINERRTIPKMPD
jgi:hypothetical protein